jgi:hypothetical protein
MKNRRVFAILLSVLMVVALVPASVFADTPAHTINASGICTITGDINSYADLEELVENPSITSIVIKGNVLTNDLGALRHLGDGNPVDLTRIIPRINLDPDNLMENDKVAYPARYLPAYVSGAFAESHGVNSISGHAFLQDYYWSAPVTYLYGIGRDNFVTIEHQVEDENNVLMLPFASNTSVFDEVQGDKIYIKHITAPRDAITHTYTSKILYVDVLHGETYNSAAGTSGSPFKISQSYNYNIVPTFYSAINIDLPYVTVGSVEITKEDPDHNALKGAEFKIYEYDENAQDTIGAEAKRYDPNSGAWVNVGTVTTGDDGKVTVAGLATGRYHIIETKAPENCMINEADKDHTVFVSGGSGTNKLDFAGGEGYSLSFNKEESSFTPNWAGNAAAGLPIDLVPGAGNTEGPHAAMEYAMDVFFKAGGTAVSFNNATIANTIDSSAINSPSYTLTVGTITQTFDNLTGTDGVLAYINNELIGNGVIDSENARDMVEVTANVDAVYIPNGNAVAKTTFTNEYIPYTVTVNKSWVNDSPEQRGEYLDVQLMQDGKAYGDPVRLTGDGDTWTYTWNNLPGNHTYTVAEPNVPENYVMGSQTTKDPGATMIQVTVDITNTYVQSAAETFDNSKILIMVSCTMVLAVCFLALKMRKTASK